MQNTLTSYDIRKKIRIGHSCYQPEWEQNMVSCWYAFGALNKRYHVEDVAFVRELKKRSYIIDFYDGLHELIVEVECSEDSSDVSGEHIQKTERIKVPLSEFFNNFSQYDWINFLTTIEYNKYMESTLRDVIESHARV